MTSHRDWTRGRMRPRKATRMHREAARLARGLGMVAETAAEAARVMRMAVVHLRVDGRASRQALAAHTEDGQ